MDDALPQQAGGKELRISADNLLLVAVEVLVLEIDIIAEYLQKTFGAIDTLHHRLHLLERHCGNLVTVFHSAPGVEVFVRGADSSETSLYPVADASQGAIVQQTGNVAPIADVNLLPGILDGCIGVGGILQLYHADGHTVHIEQHIGPTVLGYSIIDIVNGKLVDNAEDVFLGILKVYQVDGCRLTVFVYGRQAIHHPFIYLMQGGKICVGPHQPDVVGYSLQLLVFHILVVVLQKLKKVVHIQHLFPVGPGHRITKLILPSFSFQEDDKSVLIVALYEMAVDVFQSCHN